jgi:hypothetical protein
MQTMEQGLADLVIREVITQETALARSSRPEQLLGLLERSGHFEDEEAEDAAAASGLRLAGS